MNILYIGDVMGEPGIEAVLSVLPDLKKEQAIDLVIAQSENVTDGKSMSIADMKRLQSAGINFFTGGNHTPTRSELEALLTDETKPIVGPANMIDCPGKGWKYIETGRGSVLVISLLGLTVGREVRMSNPLIAVDRILEENRHIKRQATIVNFHGDYSSEKRVIGYYLDGKVSAVIGDHWHVPTADAMVLPNGTAHITDVGMCGSMHSSLGVKTEVIIKRWREGVLNKNELATERPLQFNAVLVQANEEGLADSIMQIQRNLD